MSTRRSLLDTLDTKLATALSSLDDALQLSCTAAATNDEQRELQQIREQLSMLRASRIARRFVADVASRARESHRKTTMNESKTGETR